MLDELRKALGKGQRNHAAVGRTDDRCKWSGTQMLEDSSQDFRLIVGADRREVGLSGAGPGRRAAAAEEVDAEDLVAIRIQRFALPDHFAPPALLTGAHVRD